jgi:hypothetical protein
VRKTASTHRLSLLQGSEAFVVNAAFARRIKMHQHATQSPEATLKYSKAVIFVPQEGSMLDHQIAPASGIVGVMNGGQLVLYFEGNLFQSSSLARPEDRVCCAFGRASVGYPTIAKRGVAPEEYVDLIRVGEVHWPNEIRWDSPGSALVFQEYMARQQTQGALSGLHVMEADMTELLESYEDPRTREEWRWIEAMASFNHVANDVTPGVFEFLVRVREADEYEAPPPLAVCGVLDAARAQGIEWVMFYQG